MTTLHLHIPNGGDELNTLVESLVTDEIVTDVYDDGDSYREWGERRRDEDPRHIVLVLDSEHAEHVCHTLRSMDIPVDATLPDDWAAVVTWGLESTAPNWATHYSY